MRARLSAQRYLPHSAHIVPIRYSLEGSLKENVFHLCLDEFNQVAFLILNRGKGASEAGGEVRGEKDKRYICVMGVLREKRPLLGTLAGELWSAR